jgi:hypothetical protein
MAHFVANRCRTPLRLTIEELPPYVSELNPVEHVWISSTQYPSSHTLPPRRRDAHYPRRGAAATGRFLPVTAHCYGKADLGLITTALSAAHRFFDICPQARSGERSGIL